MTFTLHIFIIYHFIVFLFKLNADLLWKAAYLILICDTIALGLS